MNRNRSEFFGPTQLFGGFINVTSQGHAAGVDALMNNWEGGLDFFANLLKRAEDVAARGNALLVSMGK
ncbi:MAG TPA: hypothetical protein PK880_03195 [Candidatus Competibacter sp.]|nr:hypothetical protein [Candidatus Competibacteraceae bacterium]HRC71521.1 hypothetical protein [Candidatus Competibacter sp.]